MSVNTLRLSHSSFCELSCGYCKITKSKINTSGVWPQHLPAAENIVLPCNSFYRSDLSEQLEHVSSAFKNVSIEFHFLTISLERNQKKLEGLAQRTFDWIVNIDHMDSERISKLRKWDSRVSEYRIIPSKTYPPATFLKDLPDFVQRKLYWVFADSEGVTNDFLEPEDVSSSVAVLREAPLHSFRIGDPQWSSTASNETPTLVHGNDWCAIDASSYTSSNWPFYLQELNTSKKYTGYLVSPNTETIDSFVFEKKRPLLYLTPRPQTSPQNSLQSRAINGSQLFFLENFLVRKEFWQLYLRSYKSYDHWTWSDFIVNENIQVEFSGEQLSFPLVSLTNVDQLRSQSRQHYLRCLDPIFFQRHEQLLSENSRPSKALFYFFQTLFWLKSLIPPSVKRRTTALLKKMMALIDDFIYATSLIFLKTKKVIFFILNSCFWWTHAKYWKGYDLLWRISDGWWFIYRKLWALYHYAWIAYSYTLGPIFGFLASLFDFPVECQTMPPFERWKFKLLFVLRKWAWLFLKIAGRR